MLDDLNLIAFIRKSRHFMLSNHLGKACEIRIKTSEVSSTKKKTTKIVGQK